VVLEFDVPLARIPGDVPSNWVNWFGGVPRAFDVAWLKPGNNWPAESFESWAALIADSLPQ
jgi:hypothetical protein